MQSPPDSRRRELLENYVRGRIVDMAEVNIGLFDHDLHNPTYFYLMNGDEQIYLRYGGRDSKSGETYLNLDSFEIALAKGLELHEQAKRGELPAGPLPEPLYPRDIDLLRSENGGRCIECHLINDYRAQMMEKDGTLDRKAFLFQSPDIKTIGIHLDIPKGLIVAQAEGAVAAAGMQAGDVITGVNGKRSYTFGDLQYHYDKTPRDATQATISVLRDGVEHELTINLPELWWWTDTFFRFWTVEPQLYFWNESLTAERKTELGLPIDGFASEVSEVDPGAQPLQIHTLKEGDIIYSVDGVEKDSFAKDVVLYMQLSTIAGKDVKLGVIRDGQRIEEIIHAERQHFRKAVPRE